MAKTTTKTTTPAAVDAAVQAAIDQALADWRVANPRRELARTGRDLQPSVSTLTAAARPLLRALRRVSRLQAADTPALEAAAQAALKRPEPGTSSADLQHAEGMLCPSRRRHDRALAVAGLIETAIGVANGRRRTRTLTAWAVWSTIFRAAANGAATYNGGTVTASSYRYPWTTTHVVAWREGDLVYVEVGTGMHTLQTTDGSFAVPAAWLRWLSVDCTLHVDEIGVRVGETADFVVHGRNGRPPYFARRMPEDLKQAFLQSWEHAGTTEDLDREIEHKRQVHAQRLAEEARTTRDDRAARLLARLSMQAQARYADARELGYCGPGIEGWCRTRSVDPQGSIALADLYRDEDRRARAVALHVARRLLRERSESKVRAHA